MNLLNLGKSLICFFAFAILPACAVLPAHELSNKLNPEQYFHDELFPEAETDIVIQSASEFLQLPLNLRLELDRVVMPLESESERYKKLRRWVFRKFENYEFDTLETTSLSELNNSRKINCLTFSSLFVAAARYVNISADFQLVFAPPYWDRRNGSWINNQHINVTGLIEVLPRETQASRIFSIHSDGWQIVKLENRGKYRYVADVNPAILSVRSKREIVYEDQVLSLFYSNKSMESLLEGDLGAAYQYSKTALLVYPESALAWNNLGVLYGRMNQSAYSIEAYQQAITLDELAYSAKSNLARAYRNSGAIDLAVNLEKEIESFRIRNPYYHSALAEESLAAGELEEAKDYLQNAVARKPNEHHFYHQLAMVNQAMGNEVEMLENLQLARRYARGGDKQRFSNKLKALEELLSSH